MPENKPEYAKEPTAELNSRHHYYIDLDALNTPPDLLTATSIVRQCVLNLHQLYQEQRLPFTLTPATQQELRLIVTGRFTKSPQQLALINQLTGYPVADLQAVLKTSN